MPNLGFNIRELCDLRDQLYGIKHFKANRRGGICRGVEWKYRHRLFNLFKLWPHFSGDFKYPIPHSKISSCKAFRECNKWTRFTKYGRMRWNLLNFLIDLIDEEIRNYEP